MTEESKMTPEGVATGAVYGLRLRAHTWKGRGRVWPDVVVALGRDPDRRAWYDRDSRADRYCFSFWRFTILLLAT